MLANVKTNAEKVPFGGAAQVAHGYFLRATWRPSRIVRGVLPFRSKHRIARINRFSNLGFVGQTPNFGA